MKPFRRRVFLAVLALVALFSASVVQIEMAWSLPEVRYTELPAEAGRVIQLPHPSSHLGVRWNGDHEDVLELRWRATGRDWSAWEPVEISHDLGDEDRGVIMSGLSVVDADGGADEVQVRVVTGAARAIRVAAIDTKFGPRRLVASTSLPRAGAVDENAKVPQPDIVSRAEWGADESLRSGTPSFADIKRMVVHHTVTDNVDPDPAATVRAIYQWHTQGNGWNDIGYNFLVDSQGRVYEGRYARHYAGGEEPTGEDVNGRGVIGAHAGGNNTGSVGVALLGTFTSVAPAKEAVSSLTKLLAWKADRHDIDAEGTTTWSTGEKSTIAGHRDVSSTACPGDQLYAQLPDIRREVSAIVAAAHELETTVGYWMLGRDSKTHPFGQAQVQVPTGLPVQTPGRSIASTPTGRGYWILSGDGRVTTHGDALYFGSTENSELNAPVVRVEPTPTGLGYWVLGADGGVFTFGDAGFFGSTGNMKLNAPVISMVATPTGKGYWLLAGDGGVFTFGDARFHGSTGNLKLNAPVVSMAPHPSGEGYWLQAADGGIFSFGQVAFHGSVPGLGIATTAKMVQIRATPSGRGYYVMGGDGSIYTFGDARFWGSKPGLPAGADAVDLALLNTSN